MIIVESQIRRIMPNVKEARVKEFVKCFNEWSDRFGISTPLRFVHFIAQIAHESGEFKSMEENLNYSADGLLRVFPKYFTKETAAQYARKPEKIANKVYANRMGNGDEASGDGWRFKGRGAIGTTGRDNYKAYADSEFCVGDLMNHPEWLAQSPGCYKSAMYFWWKNGLNQIADTDDVVKVTKRVNGGTNGLAQRQYYYRMAKRVMGI